MDGITIFVPGLRSQLVLPKIDYVAPPIKAQPKSDSALTSKLEQHQQLLQSDIGKGLALSAEFIGHVNNAIIELTNVTVLITEQVNSYDDLIAQLTILAEQTLSAADNSFHYANSFDRGVIAYQQNIDDSQYVNYWRALNMDASGRISAEVYGNGITNDYTYNQSTGQLQSLHTGLLSIEPIRHLEYTYDAYNNVTYKDDRVNDIHESYIYDRLDRLTTAAVSSGLYNNTTFNTTQDLQYNALGNITYKSDVGYYTYTGTSPHAVNNTNGNAARTNYLYDANGNMKSGAGRSMVWNSFNKPVSISKAGKQANFFYGPSRARYKKINHQGDTTHYLGNYEKIQYADGKQEQKHYIYAAGKLVAEEIVSSTEGVQTRYLHQDALGSVDLVTDAFANVVDKRSFDAWGKLRDFPWKAQATINDPLYLTQLPFTNKGFTGHESIQEVGLIHMNGRVYDAELARFISADPQVQFAGDSQSYNRYSYVHNNPMKYTDPSGFGLFSSIKKAFKKIAGGLRKIGRALKPVAGIIVGAVVALYCPPCAAFAGNSIALGALAGAAAGATTAAINGGNILKGAITGGISGAVFGYIGLNYTGNEAIAAHAIAGGAMSVVRGGKFGEGFLSAGFAKYAMLGFEKAGYINLANRKFDAVMGRTTISAVVGGTASVIGGGKFANGAQTAAFAHLLNYELSHVNKAAAARANSIFKFFFGNISQQKIAQKHIDFADKILDLGIERTNAMGPIQAIVTVMGGGLGMHAKSFADMALNVSVDTYFEGFSSWSLLINPSSFENPVVTNSARNQIRRIYKFPFDDRYRYK